MVDIFAILLKSGYRFFYHYKLVNKHFVLGSNMWSCVLIFMPVNVELSAEQETITIGLVVGFLNFQL